MILREIQVLSIAGVSLELIADSPLAENFVLEKATSDGKGIVTVTQVADLTKSRQHQYNPADWFKDPAKWFAGQDKIPKP